MDATVKWSVVLTLPGQFFSELENSIDVIYSPIKMLKIIKSIYNLKTV